LHAALLAWASAETRTRRAQRQASTSAERLLKPRRTVVKSRATERLLKAEDAAGMRRANAPRNLAEELEGREACRRQAPNPLSRTPQTASRSVASFARSAKNPGRADSDTAYMVCAGSATNPAKRESRSTVAEVACRVISVGIGRGRRGAPNDPQPPRNLTEELGGREPCRRQAPNTLSRTPQTASRSVAWFAHSAKIPGRADSDTAYMVCAGSATNPAKRESRTRIGGTGEPPEGMLGSG
jgi:hypothetical protein